MIILALLRSQTKAAIADVCVRHATPVHAIEYVKELHSEFGLHAVAQEELFGQGDILAVDRGQPQAFKYAGCVARHPGSRIGKGITV